MSPHIPLPRFPAMIRSPVALAAVVLAHAGVLALLLIQTHAPQPPLTPPTPLFVQLIERPSVQPVSATTPQPPRPQPIPKLKPAPVRATAPAMPQPAAAPEPAPESPTEVPQPALAPAPTPRINEVPRPAAAPQPLVEPRFNADYLDNPKPAYPTLSRRMGEEGEVRLQVHVDAAGNAQQVEIARGSGFPRLDQAALEAVKRWRFVPARQGDQPVAASVIVPIQFTLRN